MQDQYSMWLQNKDKHSKLQISHDLVKEVFFSGPEFEGL